MALYGDNPTDPIKTVTKGTTKTTISTREGSVRGREGTFTDVNKTTPVNTNISSKNSGSEAFNKAFANAKKQGLSTFNFGGKKYTTDMGSNTTSNETSTTTTFKPHKVTGVSQLKPAGIKFVPQSYKMGETQTILKPGSDAKGVYSVSRAGGVLNPNETRASSLGTLVSQKDKVLSQTDAAKLQGQVDKFNQNLQNRYGEDRIRKKFEGASEEFINKKVAEGQKRINANTTTFKRQN